MDNILYELKSVRKEKPLENSKGSNRSSREDFLLPLTPRSVPFGTPRFNSNNNLNN